MKLPELKIGDLTAKLPIIQGGMGIGISLSGLASAVANEGGIGIISGVQIGFREKDFAENPFKANMRAIKSEIEKARSKSPNGIIGMNFMSVMNHYEEYVKEAVKNKIDVIISGAGLPLSLPKFVEGSKTKIMPIVSSARACKLIFKSWLKQDRLPDGVVVEGPLAGGHLGFKFQDMVDNTFESLETAFKDILEVVHDFEEKYNTKIPVIAAGGISSHDDICKFIDMGASGVQIGTPFVATEECDASDYFKNSYVNAKKEDIKIIKSPVGLAARAIDNTFLQSNHGKVDKCYLCLEACNPKTTMYCISSALINSANGAEGLVFCGAGVDKISEITTVNKLMHSLSGV